MSLIVKEESNYTPPPAGTHFARCYGVVDLGTQPDDLYGPRKKVVLMFELPHERVKFKEQDGTEKERPATISKTYGASLGKKADLRKHLDTWRGRAFTEEELKGFNLTAILGAPCTLSVTHEPKATGGISAKIAGVSAVPKGTKVPDLFHPKISYDVSHGQNDGFKALPEWLRKQVEKCLEWKGEHGDTGPDTDDGVREQVPYDEDVPF